MLAPVLGIDVPTTTPSGNALPTDPTFVEVDINVCVVVIDKSGSMKNGRIENAVAGAITDIRTAKSSKPGCSTCKGDRLAVVAFSDAATTVFPLTGSFPRSRTAPPV